MSAESSFSDADFSCPVCYDIFKEPLVLPCSHSVCKACLQTWWTERSTKECPVCRKRSSMDDPPFSLALKNLCEAFVKHKRRRAFESQGASTTGSEDDLCCLHGEKFKLFCVEDHQPVRVVCLHSEKHTNHRFRPINEAALDHKEEVHVSLEPLQERLEKFNKAKINCEQTAEYIKVQAQYTERQLKAQFKKLHQFLQEEEEVKIAALGEEEEQKSQTMKDKIDQLNREIATLSRTIRAIEEGLKAEHISFLDTYKATVESVKHAPPEPQLVSDALMDVAKHLGNLAFGVWYKMGDIVNYTPVILDPNTAHPELILSDDMTSVRHGERQQVPDNPERFDIWQYVLGSEGFDSGTQCWDIDVEHNEQWEVGVLTDSYQRKGGAEGRYWRVSWNNNEYGACCSPFSYTVLAVKSNPQRIRVELDWDRGKLSFFDMDTYDHIHTFTDTFNEKLFPYISTTHTPPVEMLPGRVTVTMAD